jgi:hypothetical protein
VANAKGGQAILGFDWYNRVVKYMHVTKKTLAVMNGGMDMCGIPVRTVEGGRSAALRICISTQQYIPPMSQKLVNVLIDTRGMKKGNAYVAQAMIGKSDAVRVQEGIVQVQGGMKAERACVALVNTSHDTVKLKSRMFVADIEAAHVQSQSMDPATLIRSLQTKEEGWVWEKKGGEEE